MKVLYDCFSCSPHYGSDEGIGWLWPYYMRKYHEIWVLVRKDRRDDIERYCNENYIEDIHFVYVDIPNWINFYYRNKEKGKNGTLDFLLYQYLWQYPAYSVAKKLHKKIHFDLIHHVCTNDFRILGKLYRLNVPYIIGPIGGAQETPEELRYYTRNHKKKEFFRSILNRIMSSMPGYKKSLNKASRIYFSNEETKKYLEPQIKQVKKCSIMTEVGYSLEKILNLKNSEKQNSEITTFLWAGRMEYRKGLELLFDALDYIPDELNWKLVLCGDGSESKNYKEMVSHKKYCKKVFFVGKVQYVEMEEYYKDADVFVFPSLRETTGTVIVEAMAHGLPVIALKQGGAQEVIDEQCGFLIDKMYPRNIAEIMMYCINNPVDILQRGYYSQKKIEEKYCWESRIEEIARVYETIIACVLE